jgi:hypothetical protein
MRNQEIVTWREQQTLCQMVSATMKWMLLTSLFIGKDKTKWGKVTSSTHTQYRRQNTVTKLLGITGRQWKPLHPMKHRTVS